MCQYNKMFSHVYVEKGVAEHPRTKQILEKLNNTTVIEINHYKDVFCRKKQSIQNNQKDTGRKYSNICFRVCFPQI